jgi:UDP-N-acetylmuramyl tripeptide synthase
MEIFEEQLALPLGGIHNAYNGVAALAAGGAELGIAPHRVSSRHKELLARWLVAILATYGRFSTSERHSSEPGRPGSRTMSNRTGR